MTQTFQYGVTRIKDIQVRTRTDQAGRAHVTEVELDGRPVLPGKRFWNSLHLRFGFTGNIFRYFSHKEVFDRISAVAPNDRLRYCLRDRPEGPPELLAVTNPAAAVITFDDLEELVNRHGGEGLRYHDGVVRSTHAPRFNPTFAVGGDEFKNKFNIETPVDGFGKPSVYLSLLRLVCSNGAVGYSPAFRSELSVGKGDGGVGFALERVLGGFNNEDGYAALRDRFTAATGSWASVNEVNRFYKVLARLHNRGEVAGAPAMGGDGAALMEGTPLFRAFHRMTGDLHQVYGLANLDTLSAKRQRTLPSGCKVYDLLNFASEVATHHTTEAGHKAAQAFIGDLISGEYDLEGTVDQFSDWRDFFIGNAATTETLADLHKRSR